MEQVLGSPDHYLFFSISGKRTESTNCANTAFGGVPPDEKHLNSAIGSNRDRQE
jgi:hypothetical protein